MITLFEKFNNVDDLKEIIALKAVETHEILVIDFFYQRGYDFDNLDVLLEMCDDRDLFEYFLNKGFDVESYKDDEGFRRNMKYLDVQKILIDFGFENLIYSTVGFNSALKNDTKYSDVVKRAEDMEKYNL